MSPSHANWGKVKITYCVNNSEYPPVMSEPYELVICAVAAADLLLQSGPVTTNNSSHYP